MNKLRVLALSLLVLFLFTACEAGFSGETAADKPARAEYADRSGEVVAGQNGNESLTNLLAEKELQQQEMVALQEAAATEAENEIVKALATNGETGYAYESVFQQAYASYTSEEIDYLRANDIDELVYIPLYDEVMENVVGEFELNIGGGASVAVRAGGKVYVDGVYTDTIGPNSPDLSAYIKQQQ